MITAEASLMWVARIAPGDILHYTTETSAVLEIGRPAAGLRFLGNLDDLTDLRQALVVGEKLQADLSAHLRTISDRIEYLEARQREAENAAALAPSPEGSGPSPSPTDIPGPDEEDSAGPRIGPDEASPAESSDVLVASSHDGDTAAMELGPKAEKASQAFIEDTGGENP